MAMLLLQGRGTQKRKPGRKTSRQGTIPARPDAEEAQVVATVPTSTAEQKSRDPSSEKESSVNTIVVESTREVEVKENKITQQQSAVPKVEDKSSVGPSEPAEPAAVVTNGDPQPSSTAPSTMTPESETTPPSAVTDDGEAQVRSNPSGLQYKEDQWSPHNPEGKKAYDRTFLLMLQKNPASQRKPEGLPNLEVVRDKSVTSSKRPLDFTPPFLKLGSTPGKSIPKRNSQQGQRGGGDQQGPGMGQAPRKEIRLLTSSVRMERVEDPNVWKPKHAVKSKEDDPDTMKTDELLKTVRGILNKLTPSKFDKLLARIQSLNIDSEDRLAGVIKLFFEKAVDEPIFSSTYAKMCHALSNKEVASSANPSEATNFRKLLLTRCQREFEKDSASLLDVENKKKEIEAAEVDKKKELEDELDDLVNKNRRRSLGNIRFIGELFKLRILSVKIMHQCIIRLLKDDDEESLECLCRLLSTIGKELETPMQPTGPRSSVSQQSRDTMNGYFTQLDVIVRQRKTSNRIRFMIQDVMDLRRNQWKPRREDNNPKTIEQIHKDAERERTEQEQELMNAPNYPGQMGQSSRDRPGDRRDRDDRNRKTSRGGAGEDGWTISGSRSNPKVDMKQLRIPRLAQAGDADQQGTVMLGPAGRGMGHSWGRGASGGMSTSITTESSNVGSGGGRSNRYQLLEDDSGTHGNIPDKAPFGGRSSLGGPPSRSHQEYRPMSGATKSAFFPPKDSERERCLDAVRSQNSGPLGRSRSQQSSRESSVTRPVKETPQPKPISRELVKEPLLGKPGLTDDEIERKVNSLLGEYFSNGIMEDVVLDLKESLHSSNVPKFVNFCLMHVLEHDQVQRKGTGTIFKEMVKRRYFSADDILEGFLEVLQSAEDFLVDIPKLWEYLAEIVDPLFSDSVVPLTFLRPLSASVNTSLAANFVAAIIKELVKTQGGESAVGRMWSTTNLKLSSLFPEVDPVVFADQHKIRFLLELESASSQPGADKTASSSGSTPAHTNYSDFQVKLERYLKGASRSTEEVCMWIQQNTNGDINPSFIRALVTAVAESCIDGIGTDSKLNNTALKNLSEVLRKYVDNAADLELQSLFAVQALVTHRQHPKGLIQGIFEMLYDSNVVSEDGFETWVNTDDPSEREGKAVALKSLTSFLTWLKEADPESDQDAEAP